MHIDFEQLHQECKYLDGDPRAGTHQLACMRVITHHWLRERQAFYEPISTFDQIENAGLINHRLDNTYCNPRWFSHIGVSIQLYESAYSAPFGRLSLPQPGEKHCGGHCVALAGADPERGELYFINSWGVGWGDKGYGTLTREYVDTYLIDAWLARRTKYGPTIHTYGRIKNAETDEDFARAWMQEVPPWRGGYFRHRGRRYYFQIHDTLSFAHEGFVEVVEIKNGCGQRLAWAHLHHLPGKPRTSVVKEFFVWPNCRREGLGTKLEAAVAFRAQAVNSEMLEIWVHEIDAWPHVRAVARTFLKSSGYELIWRRFARPAVAFVGQKKIGSSRVGLT
jgi:GNAT superfamily N-acetyltransferase